MAALKKTNHLKLFTVLSPKYIPQITSTRSLKLQEYHSMDLFRKSKVTVQNFRVLDINFDVSQLYDFKAEEYIVKAQVLAGGRGKGRFDNGFKGGVHMTKNRDEIFSLAKHMIGHKLITKQTTPDGILVDRVLVAERAKIKRETYFSILMAGAFNGAAIVASPAGGMDIEDVAVKTPNLIKSVSVDIYKGVTDELGNELAEFLEFKGPMKQKCVDEIKKFWKLFVEIEATTLEINPLAETEDGRVVAIDAKIVCDDNAIFRQKKIAEFKDTCLTNDPKEMAARALKMVYIDMDGSIGCMVNGAGLAMATMDIIVLHGGRPANFLDLGGGVSPKEVSIALTILETDIKVKCIFINVFGGVVNCLIIAKGLIAACKTAIPTMPIIVRIEGTNSHEAKLLLQKSGVKLNVIDDLDEAAKISVILAGIKV